MSRFFRVREDKNFLELAFHAPDSANALSLTCARELNQLVRKFKHWRKPVVVCGDHPAFFCSGGNLSDYKKLKTKAVGLKINAEIAKCLDHFGQWPVVKLALIEGDVLGGGMEWLGRFDFRWSTPTSAFAFWQRRLELSTGWGGGKAWAEILGEPRVRQLLLEGRLLSAREALRIGMIDRVVSEWRIREAVGVWATQNCSTAVNKLTLWRAVQEKSIFSSLWWSTGHQSVLKRWKSSK